MIWNYDPSTGRMMQVDPLATLYHDYSPYHYSFNNPITYTDPSGAAPWRPEDHGGMQQGPDDGANENDGLHDKWSEDEGFANMYALRDYMRGIAGGYLGQSWSDSWSTDYYGSGEGNPYYHTGADGSRQIGYWKDSPLAGEAGIQSTFVVVRVGSGDPCPTCPNNKGSDFIYDNNNSIGLGIGILEPGFGAAWDAVRAAPGAYTNGAKIVAKVGGAGLVGVNVALTGYTINKELSNGTFNTHSIVNGAVTVVGAGLTVVGLIASAPAVAIIGAGIGITYGIAQIAGADAWIDDQTNNWGKNLIK
jgi:hypothetical protein